MADVVDKEGSQFVKKFGNIYFLQVKNSEKLTEFNYILDFKNGNGSLIVYDEAIPKDLKK